MEIINRLPVMGVAKALPKIRFHFIGQGWGNAHYEAAYNAKMCTLINT